MNFKSRFLNPLTLKSMGLKSSKQSGCTNFYCHFGLANRDFRGYFGNFYISRVLWSFFRFQWYFDNFLGFKCISVFISSFRVIWSFFLGSMGILIVFKFYGSFDHFLGFRVILVIFQVIRVFQSFLSFWGYFDHFFRI